MSSFVNVIVPIPIPQLFTYAVPAKWQEEVLPGKRVIVEFGKRKLYSCLIAEVTNEPPTAYQAKDILEVVDIDPVVNDTQLRLFRWISSYYLCSPGEVVNAALPAGLKLSSESRIQLHPQFEEENYSSKDLDPREATIMEHLQVHESLKLHDLPGVTGISNPHKYVRSLLQRQLVVVYEEISEKYKPKTERRIRFSSDHLSEQQLEKLLNELEKQEKQSNAILTILRHLPVLDTPEINKEGISRKLLGEAGTSASSLQTLVKKGVLEEFEHEISRFPHVPQREDEHRLSPDQEDALHRIVGIFEKQEVALLHGVTGSGKTEIYLKLIRQALDQGQQVLFLLPEIALTHQIVQRLMGIFGDELGVYHSRFSDAERVEVWNNVQSGRFNIIIGVRSSIFLPFENLGLIIVDEEHDSSYKQKEPAPRYHARDVAMVLAQWHNAKVLLGTATPSVESYYHAQSGKYGLVHLEKRFQEAQLPEINLIDLKEERKRNTLKGIFSGYLLREVSEALDRDEQVILFQNRRGYSPTIQCETCSWIPKCTRCDISLTLHQYKNELNCHYCGYKEHAPSRCPACGSTHLTPLGFGTEKVEEEIRIHLPDAKVDRMDMETTRSRKNLEKILSDFENGKTNILVGTQMVTKGLDFDHVTVVGILNADNMIHFPDYRSEERAFQSMLQVSGRAGRKTKPGKVILQTYTPELQLFKLVKQHDYQGFYQKEISERQQLSYPPFHRLIRITVKHKQAWKAESAAGELATSLRHVLGNRVLGPSVPGISRIRNYYHFEIMVKLERDKINLSQVKTVISDQTDALLGNRNHAGTRLVIDVDPM